MQIQAGVPAELVGVLQATILFFLVASPVIKRLFRLKGARSGLEETRRRSPAPMAVRRRSADGPVRCTASRSSASSSSSSATSSPSCPTIAPIILRCRDADRLRGAVRRDVRAVRRRQHRHRGDDAGRRPSSAGRPGSTSPRCSARIRRRSSARRRRSSRPCCCALLAGVVVSLVHAWLSISVKADQIISGTIINIAAAGITGYLITLLSQSPRRPALASSSVHAADGADEPAGRRLAVRDVPRTRARSRSRSSSSSSPSRSPCSGRAGACAPGPSASIRGRPRRSASTSSGCATGTSCSAASWPGSAAPS